MSAYEVEKEVENGISKEIGFIVVNFANGDMVGHTGILDSAIKACETLDECLGKILPLASEKGYKVIITADHGNCEQMIDAKGEPDKEHTCNPVPMIYLDFVKKPYQYTDTELPKDAYIQFAIGTPIGVLADVAPSVLANLDLNKSPEMSGMDLTVAMI